MKQRVGIITFHCSYNYGSMLQAVALQNYLMKQGCDARVIDFVLESDFAQYKLFHTAYYRQNIKALASDILYLPVNARRKRAFENFKQEQMHLTPKKYLHADQMKELNDEFDSFICGSDQIWNFECTGGIEPAYFLSFVKPGKKKIAYAPSVAGARPESVPKEELRALLDGFDWISVREKSSIQALQPYTKTKITEALDPTLLLEAADYESLMEGQHAPETPYLFLYILEPNREIIAYAETISREQKLPIIYISRKKLPFSQKATNIYGVSPGGFLRHLRNARCVVTNSFHATVFSLLFERPFCTFRTEKSYARMCDLLEKLGLTHRIYGPDFEMQGEIDFSRVREQLKQLRVGSEDFLRNALYGRTETID